MALEAVEEDAQERNKEQTAMSVPMHFLCTSCSHGPYGSTAMH